ncbi:MAG: hypothetical protein ACRDQ5_09885, partial [Sciscionella sp.]
MADHSDTGGTNGADTGTPEREVPPPDELVRRWTSAVVNTTHVPLSRSEVRELLTGFADALAAAVVAGPDAPTEVSSVGAQVGRDLVAAFISSPEALGSTVDILGRHLLSSAGIEDTAENR